MKMQGTCGFLVFLAVCFPRAVAAQALIIPQIADGGAWQTTLVLTNTSASPATVTLSFFQETTGGATQSWNLPLLEVSSTQNLSLPGAGTLFLHTPGTASTTSVGWGQVEAATGTVVAYAIFTQRVSGLPDQDCTAPAAAGATRILMPFDNTSGFVTSMAIANPGSSAESVSVGIETTKGSISQPSPISLPAQGHTAFTVPQQFPAAAGQSGLMEFYSATGNISVIALRFNPTGSFTAAPVYAESGTPIIGSTAPTGSNPYQSFGPYLYVTFQPAGFASGTELFAFTPNADNITYSVSFGGTGVFTNGTFTNNGQTFTANVLQSNLTLPPYGGFAGPGGNVLLISSASLSFTLTPTTTAGQAVTGNLAGTLSVTGTPPLGGASVTMAGPITGTYTAVLK